MAGGERVPHRVAYRQVRANVGRLLHDRPDAAGYPVPACPGWTVRDLVAHLAEVSSAVICGWEGRPDSARLSGEGLGVEVLLAEWNAMAERADRLLSEADPRQGGIAVMDAFTHELDLRYALRVPPPAEHPAYPGALDTLVQGLSRSLTAHGLPALGLEAEGDQWVAGAGEPGATVRADRLDLCRSLAGRRTPEQIGALSWDTDPTRWLPAFTWGPFRPPVEPLAEPLAEPLSTARQDAGPTSAPRHRSGR
ncbi:maleylpyruvate isomerase family mycothiol-dependent enzyme [Amycolatopsis saalfeldensis]|uniref:TIGR03083 family protein n=1 Tax=Amycolatopsis saalfeldensis TaxID=394193 RepID=A0A1H8YK42_9PSEU|nr:maleylpyruvate isomerase family mycothiol-dependent enzyme [Amycolatopsis saalfeldensis]SEP52421.1 TIGR03083 family protein [Amycolatopsis saalfeldensis]